MQNILILTFINRHHCSHRSQHSTSKWLCWLFLYLILFPSGKAWALPRTADDPPVVMLAQNYHGQAVDGWLASEKLDGVRGFWDGEKFFSRNGKLLPAPADFTANFPPFALDGELFIARGAFDRSSGVIRTGENWHEVSFYVFDVPEAEGGLLQRLQTLEKWQENHPNPHIKILPQTPIDHIEDARVMLQRVIAQGGEGLILRDPRAPYHAGRSAAMLKLKPVDDAECVITAHHAGKGKYLHMLGSVDCRLDNGQIIRIGSGFSDAERKNPPAIGEIITFRYRGFTSKGKPRFATFWRVRSDADLSK